MRALKSESMPGSGNKSRVVALGDDMGKRFDGPRIMGLQAKLVDRHAAHPGAGIAQHSLNQRPYHIDGEWAAFAPLASNRMNGMPADERRGIAKSLLE